MNQISIEKVIEKADFDLLREDWKRLFAQAHVSPFLSWEWVSIWHKWFGADKTPFVLKARRDNRLIGLLALCSQEKKVLGMKLRRLGFVGEEVGGADYLDVVAEPENKIEVLRAFLDFLKKEDSFDVIRLENLESTSETVKFTENFVKTETKRKLRFDARTTEVCPKIDLTGVGGWEAVLKQSKRASNFKRRLKQLEKMPGFEFRSVTAPAESLDAFERFYQLHEKRWAQEGGSELSGHPRLVSFQRDLVRSLGQTGLLRFDELWVDGECRASVYGLDDGQAFYYYNAGYDLDWANYSVGLVLIGLSIKSAVERGNALYDFLRGEETYKFDWANQKTELVTVSLSRRTLPAFALEAKNRAWMNLRDFSKSALPSGLLNNLRNSRRERKRNYRLPDIAVETTPEVL